jgi:ABC-type xylose transport system substrate-binding protein
MSVYKPLYEEANAAAIATNALLRGRAVPNFNQMYRTKVATVHAAIFAPVLITRTNVRRVVRDGFATWAQVCAGVGPARPMCR